MKTPTGIREKLLNHIDSDDSFTLSNNTHIKAVYITADDKTKKAIDTIFIDLCGYSLETIIEEVKK